MQAGTYFPKVRRTLLFHAPLILEHIFGQLPRCFAGTLLLPLCLLLRPILKFWSVGAALMRFTCANHSERRILVSNFSVTCNSFREFHTLDWFLHAWALPWNRWRLRRLHVLEYTTQLSCIRWSALNKSVFQLMTGVTIDDQDNVAASFVVCVWRQRSSPTLRHVSRTHRVALGWLFDRINLDPKIQIKYIDTKSQLADVLTEGNFTRDEWNHLLCLFNISRFSSTNCFEGMSQGTQEMQVTKESKQNRSRWWI